MAAPKGNQFWKLALKPIGKPKRFSTPEQMAQEAADYFDWCDKNPWKRNEAVKAGDHFGENVSADVQRPYTISGLCLYLHIDEKTFWNYCNSDNLKEYFQVANYIKKVIETQQIEGASVNAFNSNIIARLLKLPDKQEITGEGGGPIKLNWSVIGVESDG